MTGTRQKTTLYRLYDANDVLLYVGISGKWLARMAQHAAGKGWWDDVATVRREAFPTRAEALAAEVQAIRDEGPLHNVRGRSPRKPPRPRRVQRPRETTASPEFWRALTTIHEAHRAAMAVPRSGDDPESVLAYFNAVEPLYMEASRARSTAALLAREELGLTLDELGRCLKVSRARAGQIVAAARRHRSLQTA
jgi:predicted GIY-YIG superfamily endonuclease